MGVSGLTSKKTMAPYKRLFVLILLLVTVGIISCSEDDEPTASGRLVAKAGDDRSVVVNTAILLDGSASFSEDKKPFSFLWAIKSKPAGSLATLISATSQKATFTPDVAGVYMIELQVRQDGKTSADQVLVTARSKEPNEPETIILNHNITTPTVLEDVFSDEGSPDYIVTTNIDVHSDLTISPGVVIAFADHTTMRIVDGKFTVVGTADKKISFKGYGNTSAYWRGLVIQSNHEENTLEHVSITGGGSMALNGSQVVASLYLDGAPGSGAALRITNTTIAQSGGFGLFVSGMASLTGFSNNTFEYNGYSAAYIPARLLHLADGTTTFTGNGFNGIETYGEINTQTETRLKKLTNASYFVSNHFYIRSGVVIDPGTSFRISPQATIEVTDAGYLNAAGHAGEKITFNSNEENQYWNGLLFATDSENNRLDYVEISNAGLTNIGTANHLANIVIGAGAKASILNSTIRNGLGYGIVAVNKDQLNEDIITANEFHNLAKGIIYPKAILYPDMPSLKGQWFDQWSFQKNRTLVSVDFYNRESATWFEGAGTPWTMTSDKGLGIVINDDNSFVWVAAEATPWTGCENYNAEFMKGSVLWTDEMITFNQTYWRSKFVNACEPSQSADLEIETGEISLRYEINKLYDMVTGESYWQLKFYNPDNSTFAYYR